MRRWRFLMLVGLGPAFLSSLLAAAPSAAVEAPAAEQVEYEVGGPLAGVRLPPFPTQHGEPPGYPGCIPGLMAEGEAIEDMGNRYREWGPQGQAPELELYDGSVEHYRAYMFKYMPVRSLFDRQSQLKSFPAAELPGVAPSQIQEYAEPVYWVPRHADPRPTGRFIKPVPVVRMMIDSPVLKLDLGDLPEGLYAVRVIGAVKTDKLRPFREPLFMRLEVSDGPSGETSSYRRRLGYCDQFYSVAEFYFHAPAKRQYEGALRVDRGSTVELLVHNVSLDDVLAGTLRQAIKTRTTVARATPEAQAGQAERKPQGRPAAEPLSRQARLRRDAMIWNAFPPVNAQGSSIRAGYGGYGRAGGVGAGTDQLDGKQIDEQFGLWKPWRSTDPVPWAQDVPPETVFLVNEKLQRVYTVDDLRAGRPLPEPYPVKDDGAGVYFPDPSDPERGKAWTPVGSAVAQLYREYYQEVGRSLSRYRERSEDDAAHDAAITLVRWAYQFPTLDPSEFLSDTVRDPGEFGRDYSCRRRHTAATFLPHYPLYVKPIMYQYDELFDFIRGNQLLAESIGRFVPWVKKPEDVIRLIDVYLVETTAKRIMRYQYHTDVVDIANLASVVGNRQATDPWMEWLFSRTFIYPLPVAGVQDVMISGCTREGTELVGSAYYAQGEGALRVAASLDGYLAAGGNPKFDLSDLRRYPKPAEHACWRIENVVAGGDFLRIGDVCGPDKTPGHTLRDFGFARPAWRWTKDPRFAFILKHYRGRSDESDAEWAAIEQAAAGEPRAPWLESRSRVMPMWAGVLESGREHDDYRFRRAAYLRLGYGTGHQHNDSLDLQIVAHGLPMTIDGGQRPGYTTPGDRTTRAHNLVQIDGETAYGHSWATALSDGPGARYLAAEAAPPAGVSLMRRQIALVDVDEGEGSQALAPERQRPGADLPREVTTANSYVFDVFRVDGGLRHTYCFHGPLNDDFEWNARDVKPPAAGTDEAEYLGRFSRMPELSLAGDAPEILEATWRMAVEVPGPGAGEKELLGKSYVPDAPRKHTRLHLIGAGGARALRGEIVCQQWGYHFTNLMVRTPEAQESRQSAFVALIEPYVGEPLIAGRRALEVAENDDDARRAVAVEVALRSGRTDVCFADGRPDRFRSLPEAKLKIAGEFACYATDAAGLVQASLVGGPRLEGPYVRLAAEAAQRRGTVTRVDYLAKKLWIDAAWPRRHTPVVFEIGKPGHMTTYTAVSIEPDGQGSCFTLQRGGDYFRSEIVDVDPEQRIVETTLRPAIDCIRGNRAGWVASDEAMQTFWSAAYLEEGRFRLEGPPVDQSAFGSDRVLRLWEYGVGDGVRQSTSVSLRRIDQGVYELTTDVGVEVSLQGREIETSGDRKTWQTAPAKKREGWVTIAAPPSDQARFLRVR